MGKKLLEELASATKEGKDTTRIVERIKTVIVDPLKKRISEIEVEITNRKKLVDK